MLNIVVVRPTARLSPARALATSTTQHSEAAARMRPGSSTTDRRKRQANNQMGLGHHQQQQQQQVQSLAGQRLIIPCRNSTKSVQPLPPATQSRRSGGAIAQMTAQQQARARAQPLNGLSPAQTASGGVALIVWHKDDQLNSPIFAADARGSSIREAKQQAISDSLRGRARVDLIEAGGQLGAIIALIVEEARLEDAGLYTCTIEFDRAPTQMFQTTVGVFDPPKNMIIREDLPNSNWRLLTNSMAGPYDEGSRLALVCEVESGQPEAGQVSWWQLETVTQIGSELLNAAAAASRSSTAPSRQLDRVSVSNQQAPTLIPTDGATHLTTLSVDWGAPMGPNAGPVAASNNQDQLNLTGENTRDLYLGARSLQQQQVALPQLVGQLLLANNLTSSLLLQTSAGPRLRHWRRVDSGAASVSGGTLSTRLEIQKLNRSNLGDEFLCLASNNHFSTPLNASLTLDLNLKPLEVRLINKSTNESDFKLGQKTMVECHVIGSKPSPTIRWFRGAREIESPSGDGGSSHNQAASTPTTSVISRDINNLTKVSYLTFTPTVGDNQQPLTCSTFNPKLVSPEVETTSGELGPGKSDSVLSDSLVMNVQFQPRLKLQLGAGIRPDSIKLGGDIFMDCDIHANPADIQELIWLHESRPLTANLSAGVIMSNQSLVLRNIGVHQRGAYECRASNALGQSASNRLILEPRHEPICDETLTKRRYEIALNQPTRIECHVLAEPDEGLHFNWRLNRSSAGPVQDDAADPLTGSDSSRDDASSLSSESAVIKQHETNFTRGSVIFTATSRRHFGQLLCSATNTMGIQKSPCVIQLVQSELPEPVHGCFVDNQTPSSFSIHCQSSANFPPAPVGSAQAQAKYSGTHYVLELYASELPVPRTSDRGSSTSSSNDPMNHLRSRQQAIGEQTASDYEDDSGQQLDQQLSSELHTLQRLRQTRVRRLESELPSFDVADLPSNATYNIVIYVQNSKGRSPAAHHQVVLSGDEKTLASRAETGRLELLAKRTSSQQQQQAGASTSVSSQLLSFLKIDDLFTGTETTSQRQHSHSALVPQPLIAVALIVLLGAISIVMVVFFVNKLICVASRTTATARSAAARGANGANKSKYVKRKSSGGDASSSCSPTNDEQDEGDNEQSDEQFMRRRELNQNRSLAKVAAERRIQPHTNVGSGSDTSRETNTDSTFVSSSPGAKLALKPTDSSQNCASQVYHFTNNSSGPLATIARQKRCSHSDLSQLTAATLLDGHHHQQQQQFVGFNTDHGNFKSSTLRPSSGRLLVALRPAQQQQPTGSYGTNRTATTQRNNHQLEHRESAYSLTEVNQSRGTPQVSVHSSECSSNNVDNSLDLTLLHHHHHHHSNHQHAHHYSPNPVDGQQFQPPARQHNYLLSNQCHQDHSGQKEGPLDLGQLAGVAADSGVYVISDASSEAYQQGNGQDTPIGIIDATAAGEFWCQQQVTPQHSRNRCHLIEASSNLALRDQIVASGASSSNMIMSNSFSIPVSLMETVQSDRPSSIIGHQLNGPSSRRLSSVDNMLPPRQNSEQLREPNWLPTATSSSAFPATFECDAPASVCFSTNTPTSSGRHNHLTPPIDFATDYKCYQKPIPSSHPNGCDSNEAQSILTREQSQQQPPTKHRVKFNTPNCGTKFESN